MKLSMKMKYVLFILGAYILLRLTGIIEKPEAWYKYEAPDAGFSILMAGAPRLEDRAVRLEGRLLKMDIGLISFLDTSYVVSHVPIPEELKNSDAAKGLLKETFSDLQGEGYLKISEEEITFQGYPGVHTVWQSPDGDYLMDCRSFLTDKYFYRLVASVRKDNVGDQQEFIDKFFNSFTLLGSQ